MSATLLRVRGDRPDLGYLDGDVLQVTPAIAAKPGQIVITATPDGTTTVQRYDGQDRVIGQVEWMYRRLLDVVS